MKVTPTTRRALTLVSTFYYFCVVCCRSVFVILSFFGHCINCSSTIYCFWLPFWYLRTVLLSLIAEHINHVKNTDINNPRYQQRYRPTDNKIMIMIETKMSNVLCTTRFWNNLHHKKIGKSNHRRPLTGQLTSTNVAYRTVNIH
jgi:hypothetical protein